MISQGTADTAATLTLPHLSWRFWPDSSKCLLVSDHLTRTALPLRHFFLAVRIIWAFCDLLNSVTDLQKYSLLFKDILGLTMGRKWADDQPCSWSESSGVVRVSRKRQDKSLFSKWLPVAPAATQSATTCWWDKAGSYSPWVWGKIALNTYDGLSDQIFFTTVILFMRSCSNETFQLLCGRKHLATGQRKTDSFFFF